MKRGFILFVSLLMILSAISIDASLRTSYETGLKERVATTPIPMPSIFLTNPTEGINCDSSSGKELCHTNNMGTFSTDIGAIITMENGLIMVKAPSGRTIRVTDNWGRTFNVGSEKPKPVNANFKDSLGEVKPKRRNLGEVISSFWASLFKRSSQVDLNPALEDEGIEIGSGDVKPSLEFVKSSLEESDKGIEIGSGDVKPSLEFGDSKKLSFLQRIFSLRA